jgi:hypothetical protein
MVKNGRSQSAVPWFNGSLNGECPERVERE